MLDSSHTKIRKKGSVIIRGKEIIIHGFEADEASRREVAVLAIVWAIGELQKELLATLQMTGGGSVVVI